MFVILYFREKLNQYFSMSYRQRLEATEASTGLSMSIRCFSRVFANFYPKKMPSPLLWGLWSLSILKIRMSIKTDILIFKILWGLHFFLFFYVFIIFLFLPLNTGIMTRGSSPPLVMLPGLEFLYFFLFWPLHPWHYDQRVLPPSGHAARGEEILYFIIFIGGWAADSA